MKPVYRRRHLAALAAVIFLGSLGVVLRSSLRMRPQIERPAGR